MTGWTLHATTQSNNTIFLKYGTDWTKQEQGKVKYNGKALNYIMGLIHESVFSLIIGARKLGRYCELGLKELLMLNSPRYSWLTLNLKICVCKKMKPLINFILGSKNFQIHQVF